MKKAKIVLGLLTILSTVSAGLASKANRQFGGVNYYTTLIFNAIATVTLTSAKATLSTFPGARLVYYTTVDNSRAVLSAWITKTAS